MMPRHVWSSVLLSALVGSGASAGEYQPAAHEVWSGSYQCGEMNRDPLRWPAYNATIQLVLDNGTAHVLKESSRIREEMAGSAHKDGTIALEGTGALKDGTG